MFGQTIFGARGTQDKKQEWDWDVLPRARSASAFSDYSRDAKQNGCITSGNPNIYPDPTGD